MKSKSVHHATLSHRETSAIWAFEFIQTKFLHQACHNDAAYGKNHSHFTLWMNACVAYSLFYVIFMQFQLAIIISEILFEFILTHFLHSLGSIGLLWVSHNISNIWKCFVTILSFISHQQRRQQCSAQSNHIRHYYRSFSLHCIKTYVSIKRENFSKTALKWCNHKLKLIKTIILSWRWQRRQHLNSL